MPFIFGTFISDFSADLNGMVERNIVPTKAHALWIRFLPFDKNKPVFANKNWPDS